LSEEIKKFNESLKQWLNRCQILHEDLKKSALYGSQSGKRFRPQLIFMMADFLSIPICDVMPVSISIELLHCSSLMLDDLPCMDHAELRRHEPTCWVVYGGGMTTLSAYALVFSSAQIILKSSYDNSTKVELTNLLCSTAIGMTDGQAFDISQDKSISLSELCILKTGRLFEFCLLSPLIIAGRRDLIPTFQKVSELLSLIFQYRDDLMDDESSDQTGKSSHIDHHKDTFKKKDMVNVSDILKELNELLSIQCPLIRDKMMQVADWIMTRQH